MTTRIRFRPTDLGDVTFGPRVNGAIDGEEDLAAFREGLHHPALQDFLDVYLKRAEALGRIPRKCEFGPQVIRDHLGHVGIVARADGESHDAVIRLLGTQIVNHIGAELKGRSIRDLFRRPPQFADSLWRPVFEEGRLRLDSGTLKALGKPYLTFMALQVPLADESDKISYTAFRAVFSLDGGETWA